jgi:hypothetical protein
MEMAKGIDQSARRKRPSEPKECRQQGVNAYTRRQLFCVPHSVGLSCGLCLGWSEVQEGAAQWALIKK